MVYTNQMVVVVTLFSPCVFFTNFCQLTKDRKKSRRLPALYLSLNGINQPFRPSREGSAECNRVLGKKETRAPKLPLWYHGFRGQRTEKVEHEDDMYRRKSQLALAPLLDEDSYSASTPGSVESKANNRLEPLEPLKNCYHHAKQLQDILNHTWNEYLKEKSGDPFEDTDRSKTKKTPEKTTSKKENRNETANSLEADEPASGEGSHMFENIETLNEALEKWKEEVCESILIITNY